MNLNEIFSNFLIIGLSIAIIFLVIATPDALERDKPIEEFCTGEVHHSFNRHFCDGKEYICNSKKCWWVK